MSPLRCSTVTDALRERAASAGPAPMSPALADHLETCVACRAESAAVRELIGLTAALPDPPPPAEVWDGFERNLARAIARSERGVHAERFRRAVDGISWRTVGLAAMLALAFGLGVLSDRLTDDGPREAAVRREALLAEVQAELGNDARLEAYLDDFQDLLLAYEAAEHGDGVETFHRSLPTTMVAGPAVPGDADRQRLERQRAAREQIRSLVVGMLASEVEAESHGFGYLDRRIAAIAGQQLLYFIR